VLVVGLGSSNVLAVPLTNSLGGLQSLGDISGNEGGPFGGLLGTWGRNLGGGRGIIRRTTSQPEYITSPQQSQSVLATVSLASLSLITFDDPY
jgi:hypothetical protein